MNTFQVMLAASIMLLSFQTTVFANSTMTAKNVLEVCTTPTPHWIDFCNGFFQAIHDQQSTTGKLCAPNGTTRTNLVEIYERKASEIIANGSTIGEKLAVEVAGQILSHHFSCH